MTKGLKALTKFAKRFGEAKVDENCNIYCSLGDMFEPYKAIEKELKALEIIKTKLVNISSLICSKCLTSYNASYTKNGLFDLCLTEEEFELLKEILCND